MSEAKPEYEPEHVSATFRPELISPETRTKMDANVRESQKARALLKMTLNDLDAESLSEALQDAWNDWCNDTGCIPDAFTIQGEQVFADFNGSQFVNNVIALLSRDEPEIARMKKEIARMKKEIARARELINDGVDLMTDKQVGQWEGCRGWLEEVTSDLEEGKR